MYFSFHTDQQTDVMIMHGLCIMVSRLYVSFSVSNIVFVFFVLYVFILLVHLSISLSVCLYVCINHYLSVCLHVFLPVGFSVCLRVYILSVCLSIAI